MATLKVKQLPVVHIGKNNHRFIATKSWVRAAERSLNGDNPKFYTSTKNVRTPQVEGYTFQVSESHVEIVADFRDFSSSVCQIALPEFRALISIVKSKKRKAA